MHRKTIRRMIIILGVLATVAVVFVSYYLFANMKVEEFTQLEADSIDLEGDTVDLGGTKIHYIKKGGPGKKVILVHGIGAGTFSYRHNIDKLSEQYEVYALDLKGFGYSERSPGTDHSYEVQAHLILDFMEEKGISKASIIGHSMGGAISLIAYDISPGSFSSIVLVDSAGITSHNSVLGSIITQPIVDIIYYNLMVKTDNFESFLKSAYYDESFVDSQVVNLYNQPFRIRDTNLSYTSILRSSTDYDFDSIIESIDIPVLVIWGQEDTWIDVSDAYTFDSMIDDSTLVLIQEAGHLPMEERPDKFNSSVLGFLEQIP